MTELRTDFYDDILDASMNGKRRYKLIENNDGTVSLEDVTVYEQVGSNFGAGQINSTNAQINSMAAQISELNKKVSAINAALPYKLTVSGTTMTFTSENRN